MAWQQWAAKLMHFALYALMIGLPLTGWLLLSAEGKPIPVLRHAPHAADCRKQGPGGDHRRKFMRRPATAMYVLIGLHAAAALFHHYIAKDNTLTRMLPRRRLNMASPPKPHLVGADRTRRAGSLRDPPEDLSARRHRQVHGVALVLRLGHPAGVLRHALACRGMTARRSCSTSCTASSISSGWCSGPRTSFTSPSC